MAHLAADAGTVAACGLIAFPAYAEYPDRPLKIIVAWPPGGIIDVMARFISEQLGTQLGEAVIVENLTGANGNIGTTRVAQSPADGYTLQAVTAETHAINPHLYKALTYDVFHDFDPVALFARSNFVLATKASLPANNVQDFIAEVPGHPEIDGPLRLVHTKENYLVLVLSFRVRCSMKEA